jgi:hypothetical protein
MMCIAALWLVGGSTRVLCSFRQKLHRWTSGLTIGLCLVFTVVGTALFPQSSLAATPTYVQGTYATPKSEVSTVSAPYSLAQTAGDLNVVIVGWNDTNARVSSVTDSNRNVYQLAVGPTRLSGVVSQSMYYAPNIAGGPNTVTVTFSPAALEPDVRVLEYSGISLTNPVDGTSGAGESIPLLSTNGNSSGVVTTTNPLDLLVAGNMVATTTNDPGPNFTQRLLTDDGDIAEDLVVQAPGSFSATPTMTNDGGWVMQMVAFRAASNPPADTTPPSVAISSPGSGAGLTGMVTVTVTASDTGTGVAGVQLQVDGVVYGTAATGSPYTFNLNTASFANGSHTLTATAWDQANNSAGASPVSVAFSNSSPPDPTQSGVWSGTVPLPIVTVHSVLLPTGKILFWGGQTDGFDAIVWNPVLNTIESAPVPANTFCGGHEQMADGRIMVVGGHIAGHVGIPAANIFDPANESWTVAPDMSYPRWYPTATTLSDGRIIVTSGETNCDECDATVQEIYNPSTNSWSQLSSAPFFFPYYPNVYQLPDGRVFVPSDGEEPIVSEVLDLNALTWTSVGGAAVDGGSSVMYLPNKFLKVATSVDPDLATRPSVATGYTLDLTQTSPMWTQISSMAFPRTYQNTTLLPDGTVLVTGGGTTTDAVGLSDAVLPAELWSPTTRTWTTLAAMSAPRLYHSEALLLPDGRVLISGGGSFNGVNEPTDQDSAEFFSPPYLFKGPRPVITAAPSQFSYGQNITVQTPNAAQIVSVSFVRFGAVTHCTNMSQRFLPLSFSAGSGSLTVTTPANADLAPPGDYMLFLVDTNGVPSSAAVAHFGPYFPPGTRPPVTNPPGANPPGANSNAGPNFRSYSGDFNRDGKQDILWRNTLTGEVRIWYMNGSTILSNDGIATVGLDWQVVGIGDFDGDGFSDILWENTVDGSFAIWTMRGDSIVSHQFPSPGSQWSITGLADINHTGFADILWRNVVTGEVRVWFSVSPFNFVSESLGTASLDWNLVGTADLLGNGLPELIWRNQNTGEVRAWRLGGNVIIENLSLGFPPLNWQIVGFGDFTGSGRQDILWRNTTDGSVDAWIMNGFTIVDQWFPGAVSADWRIRATPDVTGNHVNDILWSNLTSGAQVIWLSNGTTFVPAAPFASAPSNWIAQPQVQ